MNKQTSIQEMFGKIAYRYDLTNSILSLQLHKVWNRRLAQALGPAETLLDLCAGTGEIAYRWLKQQKKPKKAVLLDFCEEMLDSAKAKSLPYQLAGHSLEFLHADATLIPLHSHAVGAVSVAYGIRNVQNPLACFQEVKRVLQPGGIFAILELTEPNNPLLRRLHRLYLNQFLPRLGGMITREKDAYNYLSQSIQAFTKPLELKKQLEQIGFSQIVCQPLTGGIATLITCKASP